MATLVTGATGFVGSAVMRQLLARGEEVRVLSRAGSDRRNLQGFDAEIVTGDLGDPDSLKAAIRGCDALYHVAADYRLWVRDPDSMYSANVEGSRNLIQAAADAGVSRAVYTSSVAVLGKVKNGESSDEDTPTGLDQMIGHYKRSKYLAEEAVKEVAAATGFPVVIVNPSTPIGPHDVKPTPTGQVIVQAASGKMPAFVNTGLNVVHVEDVAAGHLLAFEKGVPGERYILGGENMTLREILIVIADITGGKASKVALPHDLLWPLAMGAEAWAAISGKEPFVTRDGLRMSKRMMFFSSTKAERELGYKARPAREALADAVAWFGDAGYLGGKKA